MDWFRMYGEFATDPKVQMMSEAMQRRLVMLFCLECSNGIETFHVTERETSIAFAMRVTEEILSETKAVFLAKGFINDDWTLSNWDKRQYVSDSQISLNRKEITHVPVANAGFQRIHHAGDHRDAGSVPGRVQRCELRCNPSVSGWLHW
ncbi:hypothetical protein M1B34_28185 [Pseudomonas sp. MAFF 302030]|uniref:Uncharacterized protein n=1 Tax=Pseudomonas morbosilactucae TaxID=2938197 RepID=A0A9X2C9F6_9PSED|nr:hypothetical protein [Pseudomonas morbosilactucae]MCK9801443.1 hypothetical protein [Pseudomonas morbosilactucae]